MVLEWTCGLVGTSHSSVIIGAYSTVCVVLGGRSSTLGETFSLRGNDPLEQHFLQVALNLERCLPLMYCSSLTVHQGQCVYILFSRVKIEIFVNRFVLNYVKMVLSPRKLY
jgi:hypothetical protein